MSLPIYLAKIKSAGMYRFTFDKSQVPPAAAETMRLVVGYSEKGPFNNPVYVDNKQDFITLFGNINKRLEKKGIFFNRIALQALSSGPILALNLKPFNEEKVAYISFNMDELPNIDKNTMSVKTLLDTNRFWKVKPELLPGKIGESAQYINIAATDTKDRSCSVIIRKCLADSVKQYDVTLRDWYRNLGEELPEYLEDYASDYVSKYFAEIYVFRGEFKPELYETENAPLHDYFNADGTITETYNNIFGEAVDALGALASDENSNYVGMYRGCLLPDFMDMNGANISLDAVFTADKDNHSMIMKFNDELVDTVFVDGISTFIAERPEENLDPTKPHLMVNWAGNYGSQTATTVYNGPKTIKDSSGKSHKMLEWIVNYDNGGTVSHPIYTDANAVEGVVDIYNENYEKFPFGECDGTGKYTPATEIPSEPDAPVEPETPVTSNGLTPYYLKGYTYTSIEKTAPGVKITTNSLSMLNDKGIYEALTNHVDSEYHYIIDTFAGEINTSNKHNIVAIAKAKDNCLAIMNAPAMDDVLKFKNDSTTYEQLYSLPSDVNGASYAAYYTPLVFVDGITKSIVPSAGVVSNNFMEKWNSRQPYYIVAGPNYGRLNYEGLVGPDYNYSRSDLDVLEPLGINAIVYVPRKGTYINSNQTAKQVPVTALSKVHVRELVIYLQDEIEAMMQNYQWELNTQTLRDTIKAKADAILEKIKINGGVYDYINVCDGTNNTPEVIDNEMIILDTSIEPARGAGKMVQRLTIHKTGGISALTK